MNTNLLAKLAVLLEEFSDEDKPDITEIYSAVWDAACKELKPQEFYLLCRFAKKTLGITND